MSVVKRQGIKNAISSYFGILLGFASLIVIQPQLLKPEEIGLARVLYAFSMLLGSFIPLGIINITLKYFPLYRDDKSGHRGFFGFTLIFPVVGFIITALLLVLFKEFILAQYRRESPIFIHYYNYIFPFSLFIAFSSVISGYLTALFKSTVPSYINDIYTRLAYIALILIYYYSFISLSQFIMGYVVIYGTQTLLLLIYTFIIDTPSLKIDRAYYPNTDLKEMLKFGLALSFTSIAALGLKSVDAILIGKYLPLGFVGIYTIAAFIPTVIETPLTALDRIVAAKVAHSAANKQTEEIRNVFYKSVRYMAVIGGLLFVLINCNIGYLLDIIGKSFTEGKEVVWIISIGALANMFGGSSNSIIVYTSKYWQAAILLVTLVILTFVLNMLLIPIYGINGAAMSTAISALLFTLIKVFIINRRLGFQPYDAATFKTLACIIVLSAVGILLPPTFSPYLSIIYKGTVLGLLYIAAIYWLNVVPELYTEFFDRINSILKKI